MRPIAWSGLAVSVLAIVLRTRSSSFVYGIWSAGEGAVPYGPFVNRNHTGTWLIMALPLVAGYVVAACIVAWEPIDRVEFRYADGLAVRFRRRDEAAAIVSLSRSTAVGLCTAAVVRGRAGAAAGRRRRRVGGRGGGGRHGHRPVVARERRSRRPIPATGVHGDLGAAPRSGARRCRWWRDFVVTGTGLGSFHTAMLVYQKTDRTFFFIRPTISTCSSRQRAACSC